MKLKDFLETIDKDELVAIGALTSYLYFGAPHNYKEIEELSKKSLNDSKALISSYKAVLKNIPNKRTEMENSLKDLLRTCKTVTIGNSPDKMKEKMFFDLEEGVKDAVNKSAGLENKKCHLINKITKLENYVNKFTPFLDREVITSYRQTASDYAYVIIIEGSEHGGFWTKDEYDVATHNVLKQVL